MNLLTVTGIGKIQVTPDMMKLNTQLVQEADTYEKAFAKLQEEHDTIMTVFKDVMMNRSLVTLSALNVQVNKDYQTKAKTYVASQDLIYEDKMNLDAMRRLLHELRVVSDFNFSVSYFLKNPLLVDQDAIILAVNDATDKAKIIASASGVTLGSIASIDYGSRPESSPMRAMSMMDSLSDRSSDMSVSQSVTISWKIDK